jgi:hypothetical protein
MCPHDFRGDEQAEPEAARRSTVLATPAERFEQMQK